MFLLLVLCSSLIHRNFMTFCLYVSRAHTHTRAHAQPNTVSIRHCHGNRWLCALKIRILVVSINCKISWRYFVNKIVFKPCERHIYTFTSRRQYRDCFRTNVIRIVRFRMICFMNSWHAVSLACYRCEYEFPRQRKTFIGMYSNRWSRLQNEIYSRKRHHYPHNYVIEIFLKTRLDGVDTVVDMEYLIWILTSVRFAQFPVQFR